MTLTTVNRCSQRLMRQGCCLVWLFGDGGAPSIACRECSVHLGQVLVGHAASARVNASYHSKLCS
jgi:hypothetical protein